jgi:hypothetical protein
MILGQNPKNIIQIFSTNPMTNNILPDILINPFNILDVLFIILN